MPKSARIYSVKYPPDFDGELHVTVAHKSSGPIQYAEVSFTIARHAAESEQEALVRACQDIVRQFAPRR